jgi:hypothetical protein
MKISISTEMYPDGYYLTFRNYSDTGLFYVKVSFDGDEPKVLFLEPKPIISAVEKDRIEEIAVKFCEVLEAPTPCMEALPSSISAVNRDFYKMAKKRTPFPDIPEAPTPCLEAEKLAGTIMATIDSINGIFEQHFSKTETDAA